MVRLVLGITAALFFSSVITLDTSDSIPLETNPSGEWDVWLENSDSPVKEQPGCISGAVKVVRVTYTTTKYPHVEPSCQCVEQKNTWGCHSAKSASVPQKKEQVSYSPIPTMTSAYHDEDHTNTAPRRTPNRLLHLTTAILILFRH